MLGFGSVFPVEILGFTDGVFGGFQATEWALALHLFHSTDTMDLDPWLGKSQLRMVRYISGWWFPSFFVFPYIGNNDPN